MIKLILTFLLTSCVMGPADQSTQTQKVENVSISIVKINPPAALVDFNSSQQFLGVGGTPPYTFSLSSGVGNITADGFYTAPGSVGSAVVEIRDSTGNTASALVTVGSSLSLAPSSVSVGTSTTQFFTASGGIPPYSYIIFSGTGSINAATGEFTAPAVPDVTIIRANDSALSFAYATAITSDALLISPTSITLETNALHTFSATGGTPPYTFSVYIGGGAINAATGDYTAPATASNVIVRATDSLNVIEESVVTVLPPPIIDSNINETMVDGTIQFTATSGTPPYTYSISSGGGTINAASGLYTAPSNGETAVVVRVTDGNTFYDEKTITVNYPKKLNMGAFHTCMLQRSNDNVTSDLKCWGRSDQLATGDENAFIGDAAGEVGDNFTAIDFGSFTPIGIIGSQYYKHCAYDALHNLKCWGENTYNSLGNIGGGNAGHVKYTMGNYLQGIQVGTGVTLAPALDKHLAASVGYWHACAITSVGLKCWGRNNLGQLGYGNTADRGSTFATMGNNLPVISFGARTPVQVATGYDHTCVVLDNGEVRCWGYNLRGQLGQDNTTTLANIPATIPNLITPVNLGPGRTAQKIALGHEFTCALLDNGDIKCWGRSEYGQCGQGSPANISDGVGTSMAALTAIDFNGRSGVDIAANGHTACAEFSDGSVSCWGRNTWGQLGLGNTNHRGDAGGEMGAALTPISLGTALTVDRVFVGLRVTCVLFTNATVKCFGYGGTGQLGSGSSASLGDGAGEMGDSLPTINLGTGKTAIDVSLEERSTCVLRNDNTVVCFGEDTFGNLGLEGLHYGDDAAETMAANPGINLGTGVYAKDICSQGAYHQCIITMTDTVKCFGSGGDGRLGYGSTSSIGGVTNQLGDNLLEVSLGSGLTPVQVTCGEGHSCARFSDGRVKCWGRNNYGQLGQGNTTPRGDGAGEMGDNLAFTNLGAGRTAVSVAAGLDHTCAVLDNGDLKCWGRNTNGQLGYDDTAPRGNTGLNTPDLLSAIDLGASRTAISVHTGHLHTCAILDNQTSKCWGYNGYGQLGSENTAQLGDGAGEMAALNAINLGSGIYPTKMVANWQYSTCALMSDETIRCFGNNWYGQLGFGNTTQVGDQAGEMGDALLPVLLPTNAKAVDLFGNHFSFCALLSTNSVVCWGYNAFGNLGSGHNFHIGLDEISMGDNLPSF